MNQDIPAEKLNDPDVNVRIGCLKEISRGIKNGLIKKIQRGDFTNNHIHTFYSFSPYSPSKAIWMAYNAGLRTAGIMDHDTIGGAREFIEAGEAMGLATTIGVECRVDFSGTEFSGVKINNPDQDSVAYIAIHGIPHTQIDTVSEFFRPLVEYRNARNRKMTDSLNDIVGKFDIGIDFDKDVVPLSQYENGGSITERHILYALGLKMILARGKGPGLVNLLKNDLSVKITPKFESLLLDGDNPFYDYDVLSVLKSEMVERFYIPATTECPPVEHMVDFANSIGAIPAYAYLGDVGDSVTGDKKSQQFEDRYIEKLFPLLRNIGFKAVTYMPSRNTRPQLVRLKELCGRYDFFEISGEDINSPRQSFVCDALNDPLFQNLLDSTWALIGHEKEATRDAAKGMFSNETMETIPKLRDRISIFGKYGKKEESYGKNARL
jgi:hypothetical protein